MEGSTLPDLVAETLLIENLELRMRIGVGAAERAAPQRLLVTLKAEVAAKAPRADEVAEVVDYGVIAAGLRRLASGEVKLLETLAGAMAEIAFVDPRVQAVEITLRKPDLFADVTVGITTRFARPSPAPASRPAPE
jgi:dihydroneopterin aldolase